MNTYPEKFTTPSGELPDDVRQAFLEILYHALLHVRAFADNRDLCHLIADHTHNIPGLLRDEMPALLCHYCESIPHFIRKMEALGQKVSVFEPAWKVIRQEYERITSKAVD